MLQITGKPQPVVHKPDGARASRTQRVEQLSGGIRDNVLDEDVCGRKVAVLHDETS